MRARGILLFLAGLSVAAPSHAASNVVGRCEATPWPYARKQEAKDLHALFESMERDALIHFLFYELSKPTKQSIAKPLSIYLMNTELNKDRRSFFELLRHSADLNGKSGVPTRLKLDEMCSIYNKVFASRK